MKKIHKTILMVLAIFMLSNTILPSISSASEDSKTINVILYKDKSKIITTNLPKHLAEDKNYINSLLTTDVKNILDNYEFENNDLYLTSTKNFSSYYVTPEQPKTPDRELIGKCKKWTLSDVEAQVKRNAKASAWTNYVNTVTTTTSSYALSKLLESMGYSNIYAALPVFFIGIVTDSINDNNKRWAESLYQLQSHQIRYLKQCIYKNNKGEYPKVFNIIERVKWNTKLNTHFYSLLV